MTVHMGRRSFLGLGLGLGAAALGTTACGRFGGTSQSSAHEIDVVWRGDATRAKLMNSAIDIFKQNHTKIKITTEYQSGTEYMDKLAVRLASGNPPDLMRIERISLRDFGSRGVLKDLSKSSALTTDKIAKSALDVGRIGQSLQGIPAGMSTYGMILNTALYQKYGVPAPNLDTWSWQDFTQAASAVTQASGKKVYGADWLVSDSTNFGIWLRQNGADLWTTDGGLGFTQDHLAAWFQLWVDLRDKGAIPTGGAIEDLGDTADKSPVARGLVACAMLPANSFASFNKAAGGTLIMGMFPGESQAQRRGIQLFPVMYWAVSKASKSADDAIALLDFLVNDAQANKIMNMTHGVPVNDTVAEALAPGLASADDRTTLELTRKVGKLQQVAMIPDPAGTTAFSDLLLKVTDELRFDKIKPAAAAKEFYGQAPTVLASGGKK